MGIATLPGPRPLPPQGEKRETRLRQPLSLGSMPGSIPWGQLGGCAVASRAPGRWWGRPARQPDLPRHMARACLGEACLPPQGAPASAAPPPAAPPRSRVESRAGAAVGPCDIPDNLPLQLQDFLKACLSPPEERPTAQVWGAVGKRTNKGRVGCNGTNFRLHRREASAALLFCGQIQRFGSAQGKAVYMARWLTCVPSIPPSVPRSCTLFCLFLGNQPFPYSGILEVSRFALHSVCFPIVFEQMFLWPRECIYLLNRG